MIKFISHRKVFIFIATIALIGYLGFLAINSNVEKKKPETTVVKQDSSPIFSENKIYADLNGDGEKEYIVIEMPKDNSIAYLKSIKAYDKSNNVIASLPSEITIKVPMSDSAKIYRLNKNEPREYFSFDFIAGPHQSQTMFFGLTKDLLLPVCFIAQPEGPYDCLFYSGNVGYLPVIDLDNDGFLELIESTDEYPGDGQLSSEEEDAIGKAFNEQGVTESAEGAERIAIREKGGRGRKVIWAIYSYNGKYFAPQIGKDYEKYYNLIGDSIKNKMRKSELSKESLDYLELVRKFWTQGKSK